MYFTSPRLQKGLFFPRTLPFSPSGTYFPVRRRVEDDISFDCHTKSTRKCFRDGAPNWCPCNNLPCVGGGEVSYKKRTGDSEGGQSKGWLLGLFYVT